MRIRLRRAPIRGVIVAFLVVLSSCGSEGVEVGAGGPPAPSDECSALRSSVEEREELDRARRKVLLDTAVADPAAEMDAWFSFRQARSVEEVTAWAQPGSLTAFKLAYHPFTGNTTLYTGIDVLPGTSPPDALGRLRDSLLADLRDSLSEVPPADVPAVTTLIARVEAGERPVVAVRVRSGAERLARLSEDTGVFSVTPGPDPGEPLLPLDVASLATISSACGEGS